MIVLDEQLQGLGLEEAIARWYRGAVFVMIRDVAAMQRAIFLQLRRDKADLSRELAELKGLLEEGGD